MHERLYKLLALIRRMKIFELKRISVYLSVRLFKASAGDLKKSDTWHLRSFFRFFITNSPNKFLCSRDSLAVAVLLLIVISVRIRETETKTSTHTTNSNSKNLYHFCNQSTFRIPLPPFITFAYLLIGNESAIHPDVSLIRFKAI